MDQLRRVLDNIRTQAARLSPSQRLLILSLAVILAMTLFLVSQYAGQPAMVELMPGTPADAQQRAAAFLQTSGIEHDVRDGRVYVSPDRQRLVLAQMHEAGQMPEDTSILFNNLIDKQTWTMSKAQQAQLATIALQNELGRIIANFSGVRAATVLIDAPEPHGLGTIVRKPTASATVFTDAGRPLEQRTVDAIAHLISGARAGLDAQNVRVIDGSSGQQRKPTNDELATQATYLEHATASENKAREKLLELLAYIPGVIVAVTAQVDVTRVDTVSQRNLPVGEGSVSLPLREQTSTLADQQGSKGAEPGVRSNATADISRSNAASGARTDQNDEEIEFQNAIGSERRQISDPRGMPTRLAVSVNVPRGYIVALLKKARPADQADAPEPTDDEVAQRFEIERQEIARSILPHLPRPAGQESGAAAGDVVVSLIPGDLPPGALNQAGFLGGGASPAGGVTSLLADSGNLIERVVLLALAVAAVVMMLGVVKKAAKKPETPTAEELVGIPPTLEAKSDIVGEADETETPMAGIEIGEGEIKTQKMLEQVSELVGDNPQMVAAVLNRWIQPEA